MSWSSRRRTIYLGIFTLILLVIFGLVYYSFIYKTPTCIDGKQNQKEQGIDCGGTCPTVCSFQAVNPVVLWSRTFKVTKGVYNAIALIENPNSDTEAYNIPYSFKIYDESNILIYERKGRTNILSRTIMPIFEKTIITSERIPSKTFFEFTEEPDWQKTDKEQPNLSISNKQLSNENINPRLTATIQNKTTKTVNDIEITAIIYDSKSNALNISQTIVDFLTPNTSEEIVFTWSEPFTSKSARIEIIALVK